MIDIGANLANKAFAQDLEQVIERAKASAVRAIIVTGTDLETSRQAIALAEQYPNYLYATAGIHPHDADNFDAACKNELPLLLQNNNVLAAGEMGLDFNRNYSTEANQINAFEHQLAFAETIAKPLFLHERDAFDCFYSTLKNQWKKQSPAVVHCFTGNQTALKHYLDLGLYIGITGWIGDRKRGENLREIIQYAPLDRLLIETDAPYLIPDKKSVSPSLTVKHRNEPWTLQYIANELATAKGTDTKTLIDATIENTQSCFKYDFGIKNKHSSNNLKP